MENKQSIGNMQQESIDEQQGQSTSAIEQVRDVAYLFWDAKLTNFESIPLS